MSNGERQHTTPDPRTATIDRSTILWLHDARGRALGRLDRLTNIGGRAIALDGRPVYHRIFNARFHAAAAWADSEARRLVQEAFENADGGAFAVYDQLQDELRGLVRLTFEGDDEVPLEFVALDDGGVRALMLTLVVQPP